MDLSKFKQIPNFSKYLISETGEVYSLVRKKLLSINFNWAGYKTVTLIDDSGFRAPRKIHRLVYMTFIGPIDKNKVIDHIDNNKLNNYYLNLNQITPHENSIKSFISGKNKEKLLFHFKEIELICEMMENNISAPEIFKQLGVEYWENPKKYYNFLFLLRMGKIHKDISKKYNIKNYISSINKKDVKLKINDVRDIYSRLLNGVKPSVLAKEYNVTHSSICKIRDKRTWKTLTDLIDNDIII